MSPLRHEHSVRLRTCQDGTPECRAATLEPATGSDRFLSAAVGERYRAVVDAQIAGSALDNEMPGSVVLLALDPAVGMLSVQPPAER